MVPPKDPYIQVRVLDDIGEVLLSDQSANLACHSMHFLKRIDAEQFISQVGCLANQLTSIAYYMGLKSSYIFILVWGQQGLMEELTDWPNSWNLSFSCFEGLSFLD